MTDATFIAAQHRSRDTAEDIMLPPPVQFGVPVLIGDCATPLAGETVLSLLWKRLAERNG